MDKFWPVSEEHDKIAIIGTGESLKHVHLNFPDDVYVLAVNSAIHYLNHVDGWFTLDPSPVNTLIMRERYVDCRYYAAIPPDWGPRPLGIHYLLRVTGDGHGRYKTKAGLCPDKRGIHTGNSAAGALQLAAHMNARKVALFGIDGQGAYHYGGIPRNLTMVPELFASYVDELKERGIEVVNGSPKSVVDCFERTTPKEAIAWLAR